jgi:flagellar basal body rod protein FlgC
MNISSIALNSLTYASKRLEASARNTANVNTAGYEPQRAVATQAPGGGVSTTLLPQYAPSTAGELTAGEVLGSGTDLISEQVEQIGAAQQFKAAVSLLKTDQEMTQSLLDIKA